MNQVELFLKKVKQLLKEGKYDFLNRETNLETLGLLGWSVDIAIDFLINELFAEDLYSEGMIEINDSKLKEEYGDLFAFEFKKYIADQNMELFIRIAKTYGKDQIVIISFHESTR